VEKDRILPHCIDAHLAKGLWFKKDAVAAEDFKMFDGLKVLVDGQSAVGPVGNADFLNSREGRTPVARKQESKAWRTEGMHCRPVGSS
jgi:hypothetical protein